MSSPTTKNLSNVYRDYIRAILEHDIDALDQYVSKDVVHNGKQLGLHGYKDLILRNIMENDLQIEIKRLIADENHVAAVLILTTCSSTKGLPMVGIDLNGQTFSFAENVIYDFKNGKIGEVQSLVDVDTIRSYARQP